MPTNRRRRQVRRTTTWTSDQICQLKSGHDFFGGGWPVDEMDRDCDLRGSLPEMAEAWEELGDEIMADTIRDYPCMRPWYWWIAIALPSEPRLRIGDDPDVPEACTRYPWGEFWEGRSHESSLVYLARTKQLQPGEIERRRAMETPPGVPHMLTNRRMQASVRRQYWSNIMPAPCELAALFMIYDPDGSRDLLLPDELRQAGPYIRQLQGYLQ